MSSSSGRRIAALLVLVLTSALAACGHIAPFDDEVYPAAMAAGRPPAGWGDVVVTPAADVTIEGEDAYLLDAGDKLRIFVYGSPNLSRLYTVDQEGLIPVPLIGHVSARGRTTKGLARAIAARLGAQYVRDPQVTVDIAQSRPFFILGEVRSAGQYPYVSGLTVQAAVAIAGGYGDRANERQIQITRRQHGIIEKMDVPPDFIVRPGDTIYVYERWL
jgi:polysaccharide biosynthesis/export protein